MSVATAAPRRERPPAVAGEWEVSEIRGLAGLDALRPEWEALCAARGPADQPFFHPAWIRAHVCAFENPARLLIVTVHRRGELAAVLPLMRGWAWFQWMPVRRLRGAAGVHSLRFDLIAAPGEEGGRATQVLADYLLQRGGWDVIELRDVPAGGAAERLLAEAGLRGCRTGRWESQQSPFIDLRPRADGTTTKESPAAGFQHTHSGFRHTLRRTRRKLESMAGAGGKHEILELISAPVDSPAALATALEDFYAVEASGWKGKNGTAIRCLPAVRRFYDDAAAAMAEAGILVVHRLVLSDRTLAASYSLRHGVRYHAVKWGYDEAYAQYGPGHLLIESILRECVELSVNPPLQCFDFTGPDAEYKRKWTSTRVPHAFLFVFRPGLAGALLHFAKFTVTPRLRLAAVAMKEKIRQRPRHAKPDPSGADAR